MFKRDAAEARRPLTLRWAGEKTEFPRILLEKFRLDQVQDLTGCVGGGCGGAVDSEVRIGRRFVGRLKSRNCERVALLHLKFVLERAESVWW